MPGLAAAAHSNGSKKLFQKAMHGTKQVVRK
jgi:hypothetical protein